MFIAILARGAPALAVDARDVDIRGHHRMLIADRRTVSDKSEGSAGARLLRSPTVAVRLAVRMLQGPDRLNATTALLQRARLADPLGGVWEAADVQWWWRRPRVTDELRLPVWFDDRGPVAGVGLTAWDRSWQGDAFAVPSIMDVGHVWAALLAVADEHAVATLDVLTREDDEQLVGLAEASGFRASDERCSGMMWMTTDQRPSFSGMPDGFVIVDRGGQESYAHPMIARNGDQIEARLRSCSLYAIAPQDLRGPRRSSVGGQAAVA